MFSFAYRGLIQTKSNFQKWIRGSHCLKDIIQFVGKLHLESKCHCLIGECIKWICRGVCARSGIPNIFMSDVNKRIVNVLFRFADNSQLRQTHWRAGLELKVTLTNRTNGLEGNRTQFCKDKCKTVYLIWNDPLYQHEEINDQLKQQCCRKRSELIRGWS